MNRLSRGKILSSSLVLLGIWFVVALLSLNIGSVPIPVRTSLRLLAGPSYGRRLERRPAGIGAFFRPAAAHSAGIAGRRGPGDRRRSIPVAAPQSAGRSLRSRRIDRRVDGNDSLFPFCRLDGICSRGRRGHFRAAPCRIRRCRVHRLGGLRDCRQHRIVPARVRNGCCWPELCSRPSCRPSMYFFSPAQARRTCAEYSTG